MFWGSFCRLLDNEKCSLTIPCLPIFLWLFFGLSNLSLFSFLPSPSPSLFPSPSPFSNSQLSSPKSHLPSFISNFFTLFSYIFLVVSAMQSLSRLWSKQSSCTIGIAFAFFLCVILFCNMFISSRISGFCIFPLPFGIVLLYFFASRNIKTIRVVCFRCFFS